jgi:hypothetical protein
MLRAAQKFRGRYGKLSEARCRLSLSGPYGRRYARLRGKGVGQIMSAARLATACQGIVRRDAFSEINGALARR